MALNFNASGAKLTTATFVVPTAVTYTAWIKDPDFVTSTGPRIFENTTPTTRWFLDVTNSQFVFQRLYSNTAEWRAPFPPGIDWTQWHHLAVAHDASSVNNDAIFYCDGVLLTTTEAVTPTGTVNTTTNVMHIGDRPTNARPLGKAAWIGIYNAVLTAGQVAVAMVGGHAHANKFRIYPLDIEVGGTTYLDVSGNAGDATKNGTPALVAGPPLNAGPSGSAVKATFDVADATLTTGDTNFTANVYGDGEVSPRILGYQVARTTAGNSGGLSESAYYNAATYGPDCEVFVRVAAAPTSGESFDLVYGAKSPATAGMDGYVLYLSNASGVFTWELDRVVDQNFVPIGSASQTVSSGDWVGVSRQGIMHTLWYRPVGGAWTQVGTTIPDSTVTGAGNIGMAVFGTNVRLDQFGGGALVATDSIIAQTDFVVQANPRLVIPVGANIAVGFSATLDVTSGTPYPGGPGAGIGGVSKSRLVVQRRRFRL